MKKLALSFSLMIALWACVSTPKQSVMEQLEWKLAVQAWSFNRFTFAETLAFCEQMGVKYIEMFPGQTISKSNPGKTHFTMSEKDKYEVNELLKKHDVTLINYGVIVCDSLAEWEALFEFAAEMGIETINTEPAFDQLDMVDQLAQKYHVKVALHNHPDPTIYWDPSIVLKALQGRSEWMGAGCDNGHWMRSGIQPKDGYHLLKGHISTLHFKDMSDFDNMEAHTVPFGTGKHDIPATLRQLKELGFKGVITIEYEHNWEEPFEDIRQSVDYLMGEVAQL